MIDRRTLSQKRRVELCLAQGGRCKVCETPLRPGFIEFDHIQALEHGGDNEADNWRALCVDCHKNKTRRDHQDRAKVDRVAVGGRQRKGPPMAGNKSSRFKKKLNGQVVLRNG